MATPYVGEIRMFGGNFAPYGWAFCRGQLYPISGFDTLFALIGTTYGGDGQTTFALPDLQSRVPLHLSNNYPQGQKGGVEQVTLTQGQLPVHSHTVNVSNAGGSDSPANNVWANSAQSKPYVAAPGSTTLNAASVQPAGNSQPHENMVPYLVVNFIIALEGVYPSPN